MCLCVRRRQLKKENCLFFAPFLVWISLYLAALSVQNGWLSTDLWEGMTVEDKQVFSLHVSTRSLASFNSPRRKVGKDGLWLRFPSVTHVASLLIRPSFLSECLCFVFISRYLSFILRSSQALSGKSYFCQKLCECAPALLSGVSAQRQMPTNSRILL